MLTGLGRETRFAAPGGSGVWTAVLQSTAPPEGYLCTSCPAIESGEKEKANDVGSLSISLWTNFTTLQGAWKQTEYNNVK